MSTVLQALRSSGVLSSLDEYFAATMGRIAGESKPDVLLACALASRFVRRGHVCVDLPRFADEPDLVDEAGNPVNDIDWPLLDPWLESLRSSDLVSDGSRFTPLVLDGAGRLYLCRYWEHQQRLSRALLARAGDIDDKIDLGLLRDGLDRLFPTTDEVEKADEPDWQRIAALTAVRRRFCVISGGPGTGKTFTVVKILSLLIEQALCAGTRIPRMTLVAPTGKAAARLVESVGNSKAGLDCANAVRQAIPEEASTIHRALGSLRGSATQFRHQADNPIGTDLVVVDEASMVDLALMSRLVDAVPERARLILLGDRNQLASVEAGAVLGDICNTGVRQSYSRGMVEDVAALMGCHLEVGSDPPETTGLWDCTVELTHSYRYGESGGIGALAKAINAGLSDLALSVLRSADYPEVSLVDPLPHGPLSGSLRKAVLEGFQPYLQEEIPEARLQAFERFRVLCAHRNGFEGVENINRQIEKGLAQVGLLRREVAPYVGRPVMVTENDYQLGLFNGDTGVICDDPDRGGMMFAYFIGADGKLRQMAPSRLPAHETVFAMTIHKSQGSEFDEIVVVLPLRSSPILTRELLYTAVTRARRKVVIYGTPEVVTAAIERRIQRASGLRELLWPQAGK